MIKKTVMRQYWRIQQSQTLISMGFWCTTLTLLIWPYVKWRFSPGCDASACFNSTILGIPATYVGLAMIAFSVLGIVLTIGWTYDVFLGLWREHFTVVQERNPFTTYQLNCVLGMILAQTNELLRRSAPDDEDIQRHCDFITKWHEWNSEQEIWARGITSWKEIVGIDDPHLFFLSQEKRKDLEKNAKALDSEF